MAKNVSEFIRPLQIYFNNSGDKDKILSIDQWGNNPWASMSRAFEGASNLINKASDIPNLSNATILGRMFSKASSIGSTLDTGNWDWDTSTIQAFGSMFRDAILFNKDIGGWDLTAANIAMASMFERASSFNQDLSNWTTNNVISMQNMFWQAASFNQDLSSWNIENVTSQLGDFLNDTAFSTSNYDALLVAWNNQNVNPGLILNVGTTTYCSQVAVDARANLITTDGWMIMDGGLDPDCDPTSATSHFVVTIKTDNPGTTSDLQFIIPTNAELIYNYNVDCDNDGTDEVTGVTSDYLCQYASAGTYTIRIKDNTGTNNGFPHIYFNDTRDKEKILSIEQWGTNKWTSMFKAFEGATNLTVPATDTPDLLLVTSLQSMFRDATLANPDTSAWDTSSITEMALMFYFATSASPDISNWNIENVLYMNDMFRGVTIPTADYDAILISFNAQNLQDFLIFGGGNSQYCSQAAQNARASIIANYDWAIHDGGLDPTCVANQAPVITSDNTIAVDENTTNVVIVTATDADLDTISYSISGGADSGLFSLGSANGFLKFTNAPDFETPASALGTNTYVVEVTATDNIDSDMQLITVTVLDVAETTAIDLSLEIISSPSTVMVGALAEYQIQITNIGSQDATNAIVIDILPTELTASSWVCNSTGSSTCGASGVGEIDDMISISVGSDSVTYTVSATVTNDSFNNLFYQAQVLATAPEFDEDLSNNTDAVTAVNDDIVFTNSFESPVVKFKTRQGKVVIDFSKLNKAITIIPYAIANGIDQQGQSNLWVHVRMVDKQLQIRMSNKEYGMWIVGQWQDVNNLALTTLYWEK